jgi:segregation and condensation protein B
MNDALVQDIEAPVTDAAAEPIEKNQLKRIVEGLLMAAGKPLSVGDIAELFLEQERPEPAVLKEVFAAIAMDCEERGFELKEVASGFRFQVKQELSTWVSRLWEERPQRYTRALLETLALIAYRQPITRGDIEEIRGVGVSSTIIRTLLDREWIRVVGHRDVPGRPAMFATTRQFLDYFDLKSLQQLPPLSEIRDLDQLNRELELEDVLGDMRVLDLPSEVESTLETDDEFSDSVKENEYTDEQEAMALARRPLDEILGISSAPKESIVPIANPPPIAGAQEENNSDR